MPQSKTPELRPFSPEHIPQYLKDMPRWAPWAAVWNAKRAKYDKIPHRADLPSYGLSTAKPENWFSFDAALAAYDANPGLFHGLGLVLTGVKGLVGTDLDDCVKDGVIADWAQDVVTGLDSYTEVSPSGNGLRVFNLGTQDRDWNNHEIGIEVYGGNDARFLTVSGQHLVGTPDTITTARIDVLQTMEANYAKVRVKATVIDLNLPELLNELALPSVAELGLPYGVADFMADGTVVGDRSRMLHTAGCALYSAGLDDAQVFSLLCNNVHVMGVALDHRGQDVERAMLYLWREHCLKAKGKATSKIASPDDFEDVSGPRASAVGADKVAAPPKRFAFTQVANFICRAPLTWAIKGVLPLAEIGAIYGESGAGKSFVALDFAMSIVLGVPWRGHRVKQGAVAYVVAEGAGGFPLRVQAYADFHGISLGGLPLHLLGDAPNLLEKADVKDLVAALRDLGPLSVVFIDTLAQVTPGADENSGAEMGRAIAHAKAIHRATGAMVVLIAHAGKDVGRGIRGWSGIKGALDVEICTERSGDKRAATITKMKDGTGEGNEYGFMLDTVLMGHDDDGDAITSCVLKEGSAPVNKGGRPGKVDWQQLVMDSLTALSDLTGSADFELVLENAKNNHPKDPSLKIDTRRQNLKTALEALIAKGKVVNKDGEVSPAESE